MLAGRQPVYPGGPLRYSTVHLTPLPLPAVVRRWRRCLVSADSKADNPPDCSTRFSSYLAMCQYDPVTPGDSTLHYGASHLTQIYKPGCGILCGQGAPQLVHVVFHGPGQPVDSIQLPVPDSIMDDKPGNALRMPPPARGPHLQGPAMPAVGRAAAAGGSPAAQGRAAGRRFHAIKTGLVHRIP